MPLKITRGSDPILISAVKVVIYGQPGVGKTSLGFTAKNPLLLDADKGSHRSAFRQDSVLIETWDDIAVIQPSDIADYDTIIVDTVGRILDILSADIIKKNPKHANGESLSLQGYGQLKGRFTRWLTSLTDLGKNVVLIAHEKEEKKGDDIIKRPDAAGASYHEIFKVADSIGYMYFSRESKGAVLDFNSSGDWIAKNVAQLEPMVMPNFNQEPQFFQGILDTILSSVNALSEEGKAVADAVSEFRDRGFVDEDFVTQRYLEVVDMEDGPVKTQCKALVRKAAKDLSLTFDQERNAFVSEAKEAPQGEGAVDA